MMFTATLASYTFIEQLQSAHAISGKVAFSVNRLLLVTRCWQPAQRIRPQSGETGSCLIALYTYVQVRYVPVVIFIYVNETDNLYLFKKVDLINTKKLLFKLK